MDKSPLTEKLRPYAEELQQSANKGNGHAQCVIATYNLHIKAPHDRGAVALCEAAFNDWLEQIKKKAN